MKLERSAFTRSPDNRYGQNLESVIAFKAGPLVETYKSITSGEKEFVYDVHEVKEGINVSIEILPWRMEATILSLAPHWVNANAFLMPYSGFCFPKSSNSDESYQPDAGIDDHLFYQGSETRGIELLVFGKTKEQALGSAKKALLEPEIQEIINIVAPQKTSPK